MVMGNNLQDWGKQFFLEEPEFGFLGALGEQSQNQPRNMQDYFRQRTGEFLGRYNQKLSQQILQGNLPTLNPYDFFSGQTGQFNFRDEYLSQSPTARGEFSGRFAPQSRWLVQGR